VKAAMQDKSREQFVKAEITKVFSGFSAELKGRKAVLFGSRAAGEAGERADFDIGITGPGPLPASLFFKIEDSLERIETLYRIDLVDLAHVGDVFRAQAFGDYEVLYE
jgi:predicted nucleotidyltransferase